MACRDPKILSAGRAAGLRVAAEVFADRAYEADGSLASRRKPGAVIHDADAVVARAVRMVKERTVVAIDGTSVPLEADTICVHGDTPGSDDLAAKIRAGSRSARRDSKSGSALGLVTKYEANEKHTKNNLRVFVTMDVNALAVEHAARGLLTWWHDADLRARRAFIAASLGWMLDSFDVMLYAMVLAALIEDPTLHLSLPMAGILNSATLLAAAAGGIAFGVIADRLGRKRALMAAVLIYSVFTAACGFAQSAVQLAVFRILLGIGMGGEWATGAALVSESFPARHRGKALAFVQSAWAIGYGLAALVNLIVMPLWGWRGVFFVGVLPALFTLWIRRRVEDPPVWTSASPAERGRLSALFEPDIVRITVAIALMNSCCLFAWWGLNGWVPAYLRLSPTQGGIGLSSSMMSWFVIAMQVGMWFGYVTFGFMADAIGRKRTYVIYLLTAAVLLPMYGILRAADAAAAARSAGCVLRDRLLQRPRRPGRRALSDDGAGDRRRVLLQLRPDRERRRAVHRRLGRAVQRLRRRFHHRGRGVPARCAGLGLDT